MTKLVLEKGRDFDLLAIGNGVRKELTNILGQRFESLEELKLKMYKEVPMVYIPKENCIEMNTLPFTVREWPVMYDRRNPANIYTYEVAKIRVVD